MPFENTGEQTSPLPQDPLEEIVDRYMEELADGKEPDQAAYLCAHPEYAEALKGIFKTLDLVEAAGRTVSVGKIEKGFKLGDFRIVREIGRGGMGVVYEAVQLSLGRRVALKVLPPNVVVSENALERFHREAHTGGRLHHSNIVPVYAVGEENGISYYAMQLINGRSLSYFLKTVREDGKPQDEDYYRRIAKWGRQVADALGYAHDQGIVHRDIKPANLLFDTKDNAWVFDFGLARAADDPTITQSGDLLGTVRYMSPEQASGRGKLDGRSDVYSLGVTLYELATLSPPFDGESRDTLLRDVTQNEPRPIRHVVPQAPRDLETIVAKCMQKDPSARYQHASEVAEDLRRFLSLEPIHARRTPYRVRAWRWVRKHRTHVGVAVALIAFLVSGYLIRAKLRREEGRRMLDAALTAILVDRDFKAAIESLDDAERLGAGTAELHLYRGLVPLLSEQPQLAMEHLEEALRADPDGLPVLYALARAHIDMGDFHEGKRLREREGDRRPTTALGWFLRGFAVSRNQGGEDVECYTRAIELEPDFVAAILERAMARGIRLVTDGDQSQLDPMLNDFDAVAVFRARSSSSYAMRAWGRLTAASYAGTKPSMRTEARDWLAKCDQNLDEAFKLRRQDDPLPFSTRGLYLRQVGDFKGSAACYAQALHIHKGLYDKSNSFYLHAMAIALHAIGDLEPALARVARQCEEAPEFYALHLHRAVLLAELGRVDEAAQVCRECVRRQRDHGTGLMFTAAFLELLGRRDDSQAVLEELDQRDAGELSFEYLGQTSGGAELDYLLGRIDADMLLATAGDKPGRLCEFHFLIALRLLADGRREAGLAHLQNVIDTGVIFFGEYRFAQAFLARAERDPQWPRWLANTPQKAGDNAS